MTSQDEMQTQIPDRPTEKDMKQWNLYHRDLSFEWVETQDREKANKGTRLQTRNQEGLRIQADEEKQNETKQKSMINKTEAKDIVIGQFKILASGAYQKIQKFPYYSWKLNRQFKKAYKWIKQNPFLVSRMKYILFKII